MAWNQAQRLNLGQVLESNYQMMIRDLLVPESPPQPKKKRHKSHDTFNLAQGSIRQVYITKTDGKLILLNRPAGVILRSWWWFSLRSFSKPIDHNEVKTLECFELTF